MKKLLRYLMVLIILSNLSYALNIEWETMYSKNIGKLSDIHFETEFFGVILESKLGYLLTFDYGANWQQNKIADGRVYNKMYVIDVPEKEYIFIAAGSPSDGKGYLYFSMNYAFSWYQSPVVFDNELVNVLFFDEQSGIVLDNEMLLHYTDDLSLSFSEIYSFDTKVVNFHYNNNILWAVGENGLLLHSTDRGITWENSALTDVNEKINYITSNSNGDLFFCGDNGIIGKSTDNGLTWLTENMGDIALYSIDFLNGDLGAIVGGSYEQGIMYLTADSGENWIEVTTPKAKYFGVNYYSEEKIFCSGLHYESEEIYYGYLAIAQIAVSVLDIPHANISLYPNPTRDILHIRTDELISRVELSDVLGNKVHSSDVYKTSDVLKLNVENLPAGMYFLKLYTASGEVLVEKVIVGY